MRNRLAAQADVRRHIRRYEWRPSECSDVACAQKMANQAVVLDRICLSGLNPHAAKNNMTIETAMVIVQKRVDQRRPHGKVSNGQKSEQVACSDMYPSFWHGCDHTAAQWHFQSNLQIHCDHSTKIIMPNGWDCVAVAQPN